ncbi:MAG: RibD family protein [Ktedonobacteraceae bacterium]|jgi:riboflavin biosynthesis pyrimidine reductase
MNKLAPLETLFEVEHGGDVLPLPAELEAIFGRFKLPLRSERAYVIGNFVSTVDGVVSLNVPGHSSGGDISGFNAHDRVLMGLLRAIADAVIVGAGTLRVEPHHRWTAQYIYPAFAEVYQALRVSLGKPERPLNVIVTARGEVNLALPVFQSGEVPVLIVTTTYGEERIRAYDIPPWVQIVAVQSSSSISAQDILKAVNRMRKSAVVLVEGGPQLMGDFFAERSLDELFLTLAPQIAGRGGQVERPGLVSGKQFAPEHPLWGTLIGVKRSGSHLFLRYAFEAKE